jgi:hypothetical protein
MDRNAVPSELRQRLGEGGTSGLVQVFETARGEWAADVVGLALERFERRLVEELSVLRVETARGNATLREEVARECATVRREIADNRVELIKWSFLFWVGQVIAIVGLVGAMLRGLVPR